MNRRVSVSTRGTMRKPVAKAEEMTGIHSVFASRLDSGRSFFHGSARYFTGIFKSDGNRCTSRPGYVASGVDGRTRPRSDVWLDRQLYSRYWILFPAGAWAIGTACTLSTSGCWRMSANECEYKDIASNYSQNTCLDGEIQSGWIATNHRHGRRSQAIFRPEKSVSRQLISGLPVIRPQSANLRHLKTSMAQKRSSPATYQLSNSLTCPLPPRFLQRSPARPSSKAGASADTGTTIR